MTSLIEGCYSGLIRIIFILIISSSTSLSTAILLISSNIIAIETNIAKIKININDIHRCVIQDLVSKVCVDTLKAENARLEKENIALYRTINRLKDDPTYIEHIARKELLMIGNDEIVFKFQQTGSKDND